MLTWCALEPVIRASVSALPAASSNCSHSACVLWSCQFGLQGCVKASGASCSTRSALESRDARIFLALLDQYLREYISSKSLGNIVGSWTRTHTLPCCWPAPETPLTKEKSNLLSFIRARIRSNASIHIATGA